MSCTWFGLHPDSTPADVTGLHMSMLAEPTHMTSSEANVATHTILLHRNTPAPTMRVHGMQDGKKDGLGTYWWPTGKKWFPNGDTDEVHCTLLLAMKQKDKLSGCLMCTIQMLI